MGQVQPTTRCPLCSLACRVAFDFGPDDKRDEILTGYVSTDPVTQGRLCFRGHYLAEMATHPLRITGAGVRNGDALHPEPVEKAISYLAIRLREAGTRAAVLVDGNLPTEDVAAAGIFAREIVGSASFCVHLPDGDLALLHGLKGDATMLPFADVGGRDMLLVVGDAFATHPVISRPVLEARAARKLRLFGIDCMPNRVTGFAERFLRVAPGGEAAALAAIHVLARKRPPEGAAWAEGRSPAELAAMAGVQETDLGPVARALTESKRPAIVLDPVPARMTNVAACASVASALCKDGAALLPLFQYGNAVGAGRVSTTLGTTTLEKLVEAVGQGKVAAIFAIGVDIFAALGEGLARSVVRRVPFLAVASAFRCRTTEAAKLVLPLALPFEVSGSLIEAAGARCALDALLEPPGDAMSVRDICRQLAFALDLWQPEGSTAMLGSAFRGCAPIELIPADRPLQGLRLVARSDTPDLPGGAVSRFLAWPRHCEPEPVLLMNPTDLQARELRARSRVVVRANGNEALATVRSSSDVPCGMASISTAFEETKPLFPRRSYGDGLSEPCWSEADVTVLEKE